MALMTVTYRTPEDPEEFMRHYREVHIPMTLGLPGLLSYEITEGPIIVDGDQDVFLVAVLRFTDMDAARVAFESPLGQECAWDRRRMAPNAGDSFLVLADSQSHLTG